MGYSRWRLNYLEIITLSNLTHIMSMIDSVAISVKIIRIDRGFSLEKEFIELIHMNP